MGDATVVYEVLGDGKAQSVTFAADATGSISQESSVSLPWRREVSMERSWGALTVSAQNAASGDLTCRITVDDQTVNETSALREYAVVSSVRGRCRERAHPHPERDRRRTTRAQRRHRPRLTNPGRGKQPAR